MRVVAGLVGVALAHQHLRQTPEVIAPKDAPKVVVTEAKATEADVHTQLHADSESTPILSAPESSPPDKSQSLLVCNAFSKDEVGVNLNDKQQLTADGPLKYKECRYFPAKVVKDDRLMFTFDDQTGGTFEVTDLPAGDAVLLLVLERRDTTSKRINFQSYAFPKTTADQAQVAVIDAYKGKDMGAVLTMEDHVVIKNDGKPLQLQRVRLEELEFNKVYSVEAGEYDADISFVEDPTLREKKHTAKKMLRFQKGRDYVLLRTGVDDEQELVSFPGLEQSSAAVVSLAALVCLLW